MTLCWINDMALGSKHMGLSPVALGLLSKTALLICVILSNVALSEEQAMDPTKPVIGTLESSQDQTSKDESALNTGPKLQQLIGNDSQWTAIINGQAYRIGESGPGFKVLQINSQGVLIETTEESYWLLLNASNVEVREHDENKAGVRP